METHSQETNQDPNADAKARLFKEVLIAHKGGHIDHITDPDLKLIALQCQSADLAMKLFKGERRLEAQLKQQQKANQSLSEQVGVIKVWMLALFFGGMLLGLIIAIVCLEGAK